jgi:branched-chain amino acid transport system permease protein
MTSTATSEAALAAPAAPPSRPRRVRMPLIGVAAWLALMLALPWVVNSDLWMGIGVFTLIAGIGALGMQVVTGFAGQISLGHAAFLGVGATVGAWLGADQGLPWLVWIPAAAVITGLLGAAVAPVAVRIRGLYLAVATLALVFIVQYVLEVWTDVSGGINGRSAAPITINGQDLLQGYYSGDRQVLTSFQAWWYFALAFLLLVMLATWNLKRSRVGRAFMAVRDRDLAAGVAGVPVTATKVTAFAISAAMAGLSGALLSAYMGYFSPGQWSLMLSVDFIAMVVIGGLGSVAGALLGALFVRAMPQVVTSLSDYLPFISNDATSSGGVTAPLLSQFLYGLVIVLVLIFEPKGLVALVTRPFRWWRDRMRAKR